MTEVVDRPYSEPICAELVRAGVHPVLARVYAARGVSGADQLELTLQRLLAPEGSEVPEGPRQRLHDGGAVVPGFSHRRSHDSAERPQGAGRE